LSPTLLVGDLVRLKLIRRTKQGLLPTRSDAIVNRMSATTIQYASNALGRLLSTITRNLGDGKNTRLIERAAFVPDFPEPLLRDFSLFVQRQGSALTNSVNEWLEARRPKGRVTDPLRHARGRGNRRLQAGIHVYAFAVPSEGT
jgi:hypothetical protein